MCFCCVYIAMWAQNIATYLCSLVELYGDGNGKPEPKIVLMEEMLHQLILRISHGSFVWVFSQVVSRISSIHSITWKLTLGRHAFPFNTVPFQGTSRSFSGGMPFFFSRVNPWAIHRKKLLCCSAINPKEECTSRRSYVTLCPPMCHRYMNMI